MIKIKINGIVQGVGFRPFVYRVANEFGLKGYVINTSSGVLIKTDGDDEIIKKFIKKIKTSHPLPAKIEKIEFEQDNTKEEIYDSFSIKKSSNTEGSTLISPDLIVCRDCINELFSPLNPRYDYAFINCTNCGPRYSIIEEIPYDRPFTSMKPFKMCPRCFTEYHNPSDRRFHAQPVACPDCGPQLQFLDSNFKIIKGDPVKNTIKFLLKGKIIGIKGIGGFHIACDATTDEAVNLLRKRKKRPHKPFAVMVYPEQIHSIVHIKSAEMKLLNSLCAPILLLPKKELNPISKFVAPENPYFGVFVPYTPIQHLILSKNLPFLIMTSCNFSEEPIAIDEREVEGLCDYYLTHNRPILNRCDDSIILPIPLTPPLIRGEKELEGIMIRRSRGYVPYPIDLPFDTIPTLGVGAEFKNTFALSNKKTLFMSPYIGDIDNKKTIDFYIETLEKYKKWFKIKPELVACDLHPDYVTTKFASELGLPVRQVQHHFAHIAGVMAEYGINEPVIGVAFDGTGYGTDGKFWGGEIMIADYKKFQRVFHLNYMPLPGGDAATKHPVRIAIAYLTAIGEFKEEGELEDKDKGEAEKLEIHLIRKQLEKGFNIFYTSSMGRLFDCVDAMLGRIKNISFESQAAVDMEFLANYKTSKVYPYEIEKDVINIIPLLKAICEDIRKNKNVKLIARTFHNTVIKFTIDAVSKTNKISGIKKVVLSGGVMQNKIILKGLIKGLIKQGFEVFTPTKILVNDSGISAGQVVIANYSMH